MLDDILPAIRHLNNHLRGSLVRGAFASQKPSPGTCFARGESGLWRVSCPSYQHSSSAAGKQWLAQDGFEGVVFSCNYCLSRCASCTFTYTLFRLAILQIPNLLMRQSLICMCVIKKKKKRIERAYEFKSRDAMLSFRYGSPKRSFA